METPTRINTTFEMPVYLDATLAGLTALLPLPLVDWWLEDRFRNRMPEQIAQHHGRKLSPEVRRIVNSGGRSWLGSGIMFVLKLPFRLILKLSRKIFYIFAIKEATDKVSYYWQRAFLLDHMIQAGHLDTPRSAEPAQQALEQALKGTRAPLTALAGEVAQRVWELRPFQRRSSEEELRTAAVGQRDFMAGRWAAYESFLVDLAGRYNRSFEELRRTA
ncbi:MAG: hypothetical protein HC822_17660 [Oscillochloris sp.]|nr:hypothetical protein [Oscillochloris sp.]